MPKKIKPPFYVQYTYVIDGTLHESSLSVPEGLTDDLYLMIGRGLMTSDLLTDSGTGLDVLWAQRSAILYAFTAYQIATVREGEMIRPIFTSPGFSG